MCCDNWGLGNIESENDDAAYGLVKSCLHKLAEKKNDIPFYFKSFGLNENNVCPIKEGPVGCGQSAPWRPQMSRHAFCELYTCKFCGSLFIRIHLSSRLHVHFVEHLKAIYITKMSHESDFSFIYFLWSQYLLLCVCSIWDP